MVSTFSLTKIVFTLKDFLVLLHDGKSEKITTETAVYLAAAEGSNPFFSIDPGIIVWVWIVFFTTLAILYAVAWKPILKMLRQREHLISKSMINAKKIEKDLKKTKETIAEMIETAKEKEKEILSFARKQSEELKYSVEKKARDEATHMIAQAKETIAAERKEAIELLREEVGKLSLQIAKKILDSEIDEEKNKKVLQKHLAKL